MDSLTGVSNRNAYEKDKEELYENISIYDSLWCVLVDVLLKEVNEKLEEYNSDQMLKLEVAVGYSKYDLNRDTCWEDFIRRADEMMYKQKKAMKNKG